jgi:hypothetical protein
LFDAIGMFNMDVAGRLAYGFQQIRGFAHDPTDDP